jgi:excisionase family DNA binding protein
MANQTDVLLTRKEAALKLRVSYPTLKRWRDKQILLGFKIGNTIRYRQEDIEKLLTPKSQQNG